MFQRTADVAFSLLALLLLAPILLPIMLVLRFSGEGEVFYVQERIGKNGKPFELLKFATMLKNSPSIGTGTVTTKDDPRVLPVGRLLRKSKINELPQILNVLRGDMSIIGPRPMTPDNFAAYPPSVRAVILEHRPGLSGIGSIIFRDEESILAGEDVRWFHANVIAPYKAELEAWYARRNSVALYFTLIGLTGWAILVPRSNAIWSVFPDLPRPAAALADKLGCASAA